MKRSLLMLSIVFASACAMSAAGAASAASSVVGHLYVNDNTAGVAVRRGQPCLVERRQSCQHRRARRPGLRRQRRHCHQPRRDQLDRPHAQCRRPPAPVDGFDRHAPRRISAVNTCSL